jgi:hypothetical protein
LATVALSVAAFLMTIIGLLKAALYQHGQAR